MFKKRQLSIILALVVADILVLLMIQSSNFWFVKNYDQELFRFGWLSFALILVLGLWVVIKLDLVGKYPLILSVIMAGIVANILERLYFGYVTDYINFGIGVANLADLEIYFGTLYICMKEFFPYFKDQFNFKTLSK
jgi:lipoprotein signal peptidase